MIYEINVFFCYTENVFASNNITLAQDCYENNTDFQNLNDIEFKNKKSSQDPWTTLLAKAVFFISWNLVNFSDKYFPISMKIISVFTDTEMWKLFCIQSWFYVNCIHTFQQFFFAIKIHLHMYICGVFVTLIKD